MTERAPETYDIGNKSTLHALSVPTRIVKIRPKLENSIGKQVTNMKKCKVLSSRCKTQVFRQEIGPRPQTGRQWKAIIANFATGKENGRENGVMGELHVQS